MLIGIPNRQSAFDNPSICNHQPPLFSVLLAKLSGELYPFPVGATEALVASYPRLEEVVWAQEEPQNMGAWRAIRHRLEDAVGDLPLLYVGRPWRASTSEGYPTAHQRMQDRIVRDALEVPDAVPVPSITTQD